MKTIILTITALTTLSTAFAGESLLGLQDHFDSNYCSPKLFGKLTEYKNELKDTAQSINKDITTIKNSLNAAAKPWRSKKGVCIASKRASLAADSLNESYRALIKGQASPILGDAGATRPIASEVSEFSRRVRGLKRDACSSNKKEVVLYAQSLNSDFGKIEYKLENSGIASNGDYSSPSQFAQEINQSYSRFTAFCTQHYEKLSSSSSSQKTNCQDSFNQKPFYGSAPSTSKSK
jgi:hypothetical protein